MSTPDLQRLAAHVTERRLQLNLSLQRAAGQAGLSLGTWKRVERAEVVRHITYDRVERALGWTVGSCRKVLDGGDPVELDETPGAATLVRVPAEDLEEHIRDAVQVAMVAGTDLNAITIREVNERAMAILRARGILPPDAD